MMDWETLLGLTGIYLLLLSGFVYHWYSTKKIIEVAECSTKILLLLKSIIVGVDETERDATRDLEIYERVMKK
jgi:hypothetical protein